MDKIYVLGSVDRLEDFQERTQHISVDIQVLNSLEALPDLGKTALLFDLNLDENVERLEHYASHTHLTVVGAAVKRSLGDMAAASKKPIQCLLFGINALPSFLRKEMWELSCWKTGTKKELQQLFTPLDIDIQIVEDRVGMVTPRIISMIINEACYTVQEGTATQDAIDQAMKLGVNYPGGPFEWLSQVGVKHVYELLKSMSQDTGDSRYKIAPLLRKLYLEAQTTIA